MGPWTFLLEVIQFGLIGAMYSGLRYHSRRLTVMEQHHDYILHLRRKYVVTQDPVTPMTKRDPR